MPASIRLPSRTHRLRCALVGALAAAIGAVAGMPSAEAKREFWSETLFRSGEDTAGGTVRSIAQTADGYVWLSHLKVLTRLGGVRPAIIDNVDAATLATDARGDLWALGVDGVLHRLGDRPLSFRDPRIARGGGVHSIFQPLRDGRLVLQVNIDTPLFVFDGERLSPQSLPDARPLSHTVGIAYRSPDDFRYATVQGVFHVVDGRVGAVDLGPCSGKPIERMIEGREGRLWLSFGDAGVCGPVGVDAPPQRIDGSVGLRGRVRSVLEARDGTLWIATSGGGLYRFDGSLHRHPLHVPESNWPHMLFEDRDGTMWVGLWSGILALRRSPLETRGHHDGLWEGPVRVLRPTADGVLAGGNMGELAKLTEEGIEILQPTRPGALAVQGILPDTEDRILLADRKGLHWWTRKPDRALPPLPPLTMVSAIDRAPDGTVWAAAREGLVRIADGKATAATFANGRPVGPTNALGIGPDGTVWASGATSDTDDTTILVRVRGGMAESVPLPETLRHTGLIALRPQADGSLRMATGGAGLAVWRDGVVKTVGRSEGLLDDTIWEVLGDANGRLWMTSDRGLWWVSQEDVDAVFAATAPRVTSHEFGLADGLESKEFNGGATNGGVVGADGLLHFANVAGVVTVDPSRIVTDRASPKTTLGDIVLDERDRLDASNVVPAGTRRLEFHYDAPTSMDAAGLRFRYRLDGFDADWIEAGDRREAVYTALSPGTYTFRVEARAKESEAYGETATRSVTLRPFFWQTNWFRGLMGVAGVLVLGLAYRVRLARIRARQRELETLVDVRTRDLAKEKARSEQLLHNLLPESVAIRLKGGDERIADRHDDVTVLFADLAGFTSMASNASADDIVAMLNSIFTRFDQLAAAVGAEKIKTIGDAYMAAVGCPSPRADHADVAARLAIAMQCELEEWNREHGKQLSLRIGLHSGSVVAGVIGTSKLVYDIWGDVVNTASRMESHGEAGRVQLTAATRELLSPLFHVEKRGAIDVKGKGAITTYWLIGEDGGGSKVPSEAPSWRASLTS